MRIRRAADIGAMVREARTRQGLSQTELGSRIGASRFWVSELEHGKPTVELHLVLKALEALRLVVRVAPETIASATVKDATPRSDARQPSTTAYNFDVADFLDGFTTSKGRVSAVREANPRRDTDGPEKALSTRKRKPR